ncbi:ATP-binding cassette domain-containing protein [Microbulbifer sp. TB1203]|uniref:ABC transporter ATP-binding protein n=1 Tax=Microbulbifer sp. TB1203 TaxID=3021712 RepID=UPI0027E42022|nr:ATP-binding cassette domain-containing protein [Microbulbifer sp. TB1203]
MLELRRIRKSYPTPQGPLPVLQGVDLRLAAGESLALMGESGSGKSTLLHLAAGLDTPDDGEVRLDDQPLSALDEPARARLRRERLGLVFQQYHLVPSLTAADNLRLQARLAGREDAAWSRELLERLGLAGMAGRYPEQLSGGQQQRLAIGARPGDAPDIAACR